MAWTLKRLDRRSETMSSEKKASPEPRIPVSRPPQSTQRLPVQVRWTQPDARSLLPTVHVEIPMRKSLK
jgi:hypothetical protein